MTARQFYDWQTAGGGGDVLRLVETLEAAELSWCMIGGLAVNHWAAEPMATADVDIVVATESVDEAVLALEQAGFRAARHEWSVNLTGRSKLSVQITSDPEYGDFPSRAVPADVHGILMRVASIEDTLRGKVRAWQDAGRRPTKRQKDLLDIMRLVEARPSLADGLPPELSARIQNQ